MKNILPYFLSIIFAFSFLHTSVFSQTFDWAKKAGGTGDDYLFGSATDGGGNTVVTGYYSSSSINFGTVSLSNSGGQDIYLAKYDSVGNTIWAKKFGGTGNDIGNAVSIDQIGNIYLTGVFSSSISFGSIVLTSGGSTDYFIAKLNQNGEVIWAKSSGGTGGEGGLSIDATYSLNISVVGYYSSGSIAFGSNTLTNSGGEDVFIVKYDSSGSIIFAKKFGGSNTERAQGVAVDRSGNSYFGGYFLSSSITFGTSTITNSGSEDIYIAKVDASGNPVWAKKFGASGNECVYALATDALGSIVITGYFNGTVSFGASALTSKGGNDIFISSLDASGNVAWARGYGGAGLDVGRSANFDIYGDIIVGGHYNSVINFGSFTLPIVGYLDAYTVKLDKEGTVKWVKGIGGNHDDHTIVTSDSKGNILIAGYFRSSNLTIGSTTLNNSGLYDIYVTRLKIYGQTTIIDNSTKWKMQIKAVAGTANDYENFAGVADSANEGFDVNFDTPEPPLSPGSYISAYFHHPEWNVPAGPFFATDIRKNSVLSDTVKRWFFTVITNVVNDTVKLEFINDRIATNLGKYLTDISTGKRINLRNTSVYKYYNTTSGTRNFILTIGDSTAPSASVQYPNGSEIIRSTTIKNINWTSTDGTGIDSIFIELSKNSGQSYSILKNIGNQQSTDWLVPEEYLNINYAMRLTFRDSLGNSSTIKSAKTFTVVGDSLSKSSASGWSLISLPLVPLSNQDSLIFGDDIYGNPYYLWEFLQSQGYTTPEFIEFGKGYWFGLLASANWDVRGNAVETDSTILPLTSGYNIIGNSYIRNIDKSGLSFRKDEQVKSFPDAVNSGWITNTMYGYNGSGYISQDTLIPFGGYWMGILVNGIEMIQKPQVSSVVPSLPESFSPTNWSLPIVAEAGVLNDNTPEIGVRPTSTNLFDVEYDMPRPPRNPGNRYVELYFENSGANFPAILGSRYSKDYRSAISPSWKFWIETSEQGIVILRWDKSQLIQLGDTLTLILKDNTTNTSIDMKIDTSYAFIYDGIREFSINGTLVAIKEGVSNVSDYVLLQNYPNPFNPVTMIHYALPKEGKVKLVVYNTLGEIVRTLVDEYQVEGNYRCLFDAVNLNSGVYLYKLESGSFCSVKKMLVIK